MVDGELASRIAHFLNELLALDSAAITRLVENREPCSLAIADHPAVQVDCRRGDCHVGMLGILNGLCGATDSGQGPLVAVIEDDIITTFIVQSCETSELRAGSLEKTASCESRPKA